MHSVYQGQIFDIPAVVLGGTSNFYIEYGALPEVIFSRFARAGAWERGYPAPVHSLVLCRMFSVFRESVAI